MTITIEMLSIILLAITNVVMLSQIGRHKRAIASLMGAVSAHNEVLKQICITTYPEEAPSEVTH